MCIEGDDVGNAHLNQLIQCHGTVKGFSLGTLVLPALIEKRHDHVDAVCFTGTCGDHTLQILEMIIR